MLRDPGAGAGIGQWAVIQAFSPALGIELRPINVRSAADIEREIKAFASEPDSGLDHRGQRRISNSSRADRLARGAARLPAVYPYRFFTAGGGLVSYGPDLLGQYRRAATYVDRILKGEKPADLPVQAPTKYGLVINLKTAKALGSTVPPAVLARADEVIE